MRWYIPAISTFIVAIAALTHPAHAQTLPASASVDSGALRINADPATGALTLTCAEWNAFRIDALLPQLVLDGKAPQLTRATVQNDTLRIEYVFGDTATMTMSIEPCAMPGLRLRARLRNTSGKDAILNHVTLLQSETACLGSDPKAVRILEQSNYTGRVVPLVEAPPEQKEKSAEPGGAPEIPARTSSLVWLAYDRGEKHAFLTGFESSERWAGTVESRATGKAVKWTAEFDGGDLLMNAGEELPLEDLLLSVGTDPWNLLEVYADAVRARHNPQFPTTPAVNVVQLVS